MGRVSGKQVGTVYFYLVSAASLALIVVGIFTSANLLINLTQYEQYPLQYLAEDCENFRTPVKSPYPAETTPTASISAKESEGLKRSCDQRIERERKERKLEDIKNSLLFTLVGGILFAIHFPQARKQSHND